jgi:N-acyl amino acid synthase of PEP-CTERM/exosortase system
MIEQGYDFYLADTDAGKSIHFGLRYQVYCLRERYEDPNRHQNFLEQDEYDDSSVHFIARCRNSGEWLGAMRLIVGPAEHLPVARFSSVSPEMEFAREWQTVAEASRLCTLLPAVSRADFAQSAFKGSARQPQHLRRSSCAQQSLQTSWISLGLIRAARQYCLRHDITFCFFLISDPLARILRRLGMDIESVGSPCQHRGWRSPYIHNVKTGYEVMSQRSPELYKSFCAHTAYTLYSKMVEHHSAARMAAIA